VLLLYDGTRISRAVYKIIITGSGRIAVRVVAEPFYHVPVLVDNIRYAAAYILPEEVIIVCISA